METGQPVTGSLYVYIPNNVAPVIFAVAFATAAVGHIWQCHQYGSWRMLGLQPFCAVLYTIGYAFREYVAFNYLYSNLNLIIFILSQVLIYIEPPLLELSNYHVLGRIFSYVPSQAPLPSGRVLQVFGGLVALVEALNGLGIAFSSNPSSTHSKQELGKNLVIAAVSLQLGIILSCVILTAVFQRRCIRTGVQEKTVSVPAITLYFSMALISIRSIYRLVEHTGNTTVKIDDPSALESLTPLVRYEWYFYVFEATVMLLNSISWNIWNPARYLPKNPRSHWGEDPATEVNDESKPGGRSSFKKVASILTFGILFRD